MHSLFSVKGFFQPICEFVHKLALFVAVHDSEAVLYASGKKSQGDSRGILTF